MGYFNLIWVVSVAYFSHDFCNIADIIITSTPSSAYINASNVICCYSHHIDYGIAVVGVYMAFYGYLNELKLEQ